MHTVSSLNTSGWMILENDTEVYSVERAKVIFFLETYDGRTVIEK